MTIHVTPIPSTIELGTPAFTLGLTNTAGAATDAVASNSTLLAFDTTVPDALTLGQSGATGTATVAGRRDHAHANVSAASESEMETATSTTVIVTPGIAKYHPGVSKTWCYSKQDAPTTMLASYGMDSIADGGVGITVYTISDPVFTSVNYVVQVSSNAAACHFSQNANLAAGVFDIRAESALGTGQDAEVAVACWGTV